MKKILIISPFRWDEELYPHLKELTENLKNKYEVEYYHFNERGLNIEEYSNNFKKNFFSIKGYIPFFRLFYQILFLSKVKFKYKNYKIIAVDNLIFCLSSFFFGSKNVSLLSFDFIAVNNSVRVNILQKILRVLTRYYISKSFLLIIQSTDRAEAFLRSINYRRKQPNIFYLPVCLNKINLRIDNSFKEIKYERLNYIQIGGINEYRSNSISIVFNFNFKTDRLKFHGYIHDSVKWVIKNKKYPIEFSEKILKTSDLSNKIINYSDVGILSYVNHDENFNLLALSSGQFAEFMRCYKPVIVIGNTTLTDYVNRYGVGIGIYKFDDLPKAQEKMKIQYNDFLKNIELFNKNYNLVKYTNLMVENFNF